MDGCSNSSVIEECTCMIVCIVICHLEYVFLLSRVYQISDGLAAYLLYCPQGVAVVVDKFVPDMPQDLDMIWNHRAQQRC